MPSIPPLLETTRTTLRLPTAADAPFFLELLNDPLFVRFTGDRGIRDLGGATRYIEARLLAAHTKFGFTLLVVETKNTGTAIGINGLVQRDYLDAPDIGFGFLERFCGQGFGTESAQAIMHHAHRVLGHELLYGITSSDNVASIRLLERLGMHHAYDQTLPGTAHPQRIYALTNAAVNQS